MSNHSPQVGAKSDKGPTRSANEDAFWVSGPQSPLKYGALYLVADGVGGQEHGAVAAQQAVQVISAAFYQLRQSGATIPQALNDSILQANQAIYERAQAMNVNRMGCTLVAAVQHEGQLYVAHVGDARAYLLMENHLRRLTRDDTWVQKQVDAGIITYEEAARHELRNVVTQVLGNKLDITVHQSATYELRAGDTYLLCSDGLHGVLSKEQLFKLMKNNPPQAAAEALVKAAIEAQTKDNVTAVVVNSGVKKARRGKVPSPPQQKSDRTGLPLWVKVTIVTAVLLLLGFLIYNL
jgi:PPM family protein phosphatase